MTLLAVDTATRRQSVALMDETTPVAQDVREVDSHSGTLIPAVHALLTAASCPLSSVEGLAVSEGPGSFTGLRAGLATMVGFRLITGLPLVTVPTLEAMAWRHRPDIHDGGSTPASSPLPLSLPLPLCPMLAARAHEVYWARFQWRDGTLVRLTEDRAGTMQAVIDDVREPTMMFGDGWLRHRDVLAAALGTLAVDGPPSDHASAVDVGLAGLRLLRAGQLAGPRVVPRYVQPSEAEVKLLAARTARQTAPRL